MHQPSRLMLAAAALALASTSAAFAQSSPMPASSGTPSSPMPMSSPATGVMTMPPASPAAMPPATTMPGTSAPSVAPSAQPTRSAGSQRSTDTGTGTDLQGKIKPIKQGSLTRSQVLYGVTHQVQEAKQLLKMKTVSFDNLRVYKLPSSMKSAVKVSDAETQAIAIAVLGNPLQFAQASPDPSLPASNGNNSPIQYLRNVLANINVSNALNNLNVLNNSNVNLNVSLANVLNNNKISIGQVVGLYIGGGGIITTITK